MQTVNRQLKDERMDDLDHALGRPVDPRSNGQSYRDHYATDCPTQKSQLRKSAHWNEGRSCGDMTWFHVSDEGRRALAEYLRRTRDPHRLYCVQWATEGGERYESLVAAKSRSAARYRYWLHVSDIFHDMKFGDFCKQISVRLA